MKKNNVKVSENDLRVVLAKKKLREIEKIQKRVRKHLFYYAEYMEKFDKKGRFFTRDKWNIIIKSWLYDLATEKIIRRVTISEPTRSGKSYVSTRALERYIGMHPEHNNMRNSYSADLAVDTLSVKVRDTIQNSKAFHDIFPGLRPSKQSFKKSRWMLDGYNNFCYLAAGVGGSVGGNGCSGLLILDDEYKGMTEALSKAVRKETERFLSSVHWKRRENDPDGNPPSEIYACTRWTTRDTIGKLKQSEKSFEIDIYKWRHIIESYEEITDEIFEELYEKFKKELLSAGDPYDIVYHLTIPALMKIHGQEISFCEAIKTTRSQLSDRATLRKRGEGYIWNAVDMQNPKAEGSMLYDLKKISDYEMQRIVNTLNNRVAYIDPAFGGGDFCTMIIAAVDKGGNYYIFNVMYDSRRSEVTKPEILRRLLKYRVRRIVGEGNGAGEEYLKDIRKDFYSKSYGSFKIIKNSANKQDRIRDAAGQVNEMCRFLNKGSNEYNMFISELEDADIMLDIDNDDGCDAISGLVSQHKNIKEAKITSF